MQKAIHIPDTEQITRCQPLNNNQIVVVQSLSHARLFETPWTAACQVSLSITSLHGDAIQPSHPLLAPSHLALNLSQHQGLFQ